METINPPTGITCSGIDELVTAIQSDDPQALMLIKSFIDDNCKVEGTNKWIVFAYDKERGIIMVTGCSVNKAGARRRIRAFQELHMKTITFKYFKRVGFAPRNI